MHINFWHLIIGNSNYVLPTSKNIQVRFETRWKINPTKRRCLRTHYWIQRGQCKGKRSLCLRATPPLLKGLAYFTSAVSRLTSFQLPWLWTTGAMLRGANIDRRRAEASISATLSCWEPRTPNVQTKAKWISLRKLRLRISSSRSQIILKADNDKSYSVHK